MPNLFESPLSILELYLRINRRVFQALVIIMFIFLGVSVISLGIKNLFAYSLLLSNFQFDFVSFVSFFSYLGNVVSKTLVQSFGYGVLFSFSALGAFISFRFIVVIEQIIQKVRAESFTKVFSDRMNFVRANKYLWVILVYNLFYLFIFSPMFDYSFSESSTFSWASYLFTLLFEGLDFVLLSLHGIQPLVVMLALEVIHRICIRSNSLEEEVEGTV